MNRLTVMILSGSSPATPRIPLSVTGGVCRRFNRKSVFQSKGQHSEGEPVAMVRAEVRKGGPVGRGSEAARLAGSTAGGSPAARRGSAGPGSPPRGADSRAVRGRTWSAVSRAPRSGRARAGGGAEAPAATPRSWPAVTSLREAPPLRGAPGPGDPRRCFISDRRLRCTATEDQERRDGADGRARALGGAGAALGQRAAAAGGPGSPQRAPSRPGATAGARRGAAGMLR